MGWARRAVADGTAFKQVTGHTMRGVNANHELLHEVPRAVKASQHLLKAGMRGGSEGRPGAKGRRAPVSTVVRIRIVPPQKQAVICPLERMRWPHPNAPPVAGSEQALAHTTAPSPLAAPHTSPKKTTNAAVISHSERRAERAISRLSTTRSRSPQHRSRWRPHWPTLLTRRAQTSGCSKRT